MMQPVEILAPAGDWICLQAALDAGADAVYLGLDCFSMRQMAVKTFTLDNLPEASARCRERGAKLYLTLNTLVFEEELETLDRIVQRIKPHIDAAIVADWAVVEACRKHGVSFHISTQMSCSNSQSAKFLTAQGASRIVLARECTLRELELIAKHTQTELEVFVHGAICTAVSGRCLLSHDAYGYSSNRGECLQPCRREYVIHEVREGEDADAEFRVGQGYVLSARDLCSLPFLDRIIAAGARSLKIEGRARNADYVKTVVSAYREGRDAVLAGAFTPELAEALVQRCEKVYHRPFGKGLYHGRPGVAQFTQDDQNEAQEKKKHLGVVVNYFAKARVMHVAIQDNSVSVGDRLAVHGNKTGVVYLTAESLRREDDTLSRADKGEWCTIPCPEPVREGDKVFLVVDADAYAKG